MVNISRPSEQEYGSYYQGYIDQVQTDNAYSGLLALEEKTLTTLQNLSEKQWSYRYAPGKWTVTELVSHIIDTERVFAFRAFWFMRGGGTLPGFDQDVFVQNMGDAQRKSSRLINSYKTTRRTTLDIFSQVTADNMAHVNEASGYPLSVRACAWIILGHENHHLKVLNEKYLSQTR